MLTFGDGGRWLFLEKKPLGIQSSVKSRIENAVAPDRKRTELQQRQSDTPPKNERTGSRSSTGRQRTGPRESQLAVDARAQKTAIFAQIAAFSARKGPKLRG
jgi:hypothetical protein